VRAIRKKAQTLLAEATSNDPSVAMKPSPRTPRSRPLKPKAKSSSTTKKKGKAIDDASAENPMTIDADAEDSDSVEIKTEMAIKIDIDSDDELVVKIKDEDVMTGFFNTPTALPNKLFGTAGQQLSGPGLSQKSSSSFRSYDEINSQSQKPEPMPEWPVQSWFKEGDEV
jgi:hypothetical protein